jgi:hypothetical protein
MMRWFVFLLIFAFAALTLARSASAMLADEPDADRAGAVDGEASESDSTQRPPMPEDDDVDAVEIVGGPTHVGAPHHERVTYAPAEPPVQRLLRPPEH